MLLSTINNAKLCGPQNKRIPCEWSAHWIRMSFDLYLKHSSSSSFFSVFSPFAFLLPFLWRYLYTYNSQIEDCRNVLTRPCLYRSFVAKFSDFINFVICEGEEVSLRMQRTSAMYICFIHFQISTQANLWQTTKNSWEWQKKVSEGWRKIPNYEILHKMILFVSHCLTLICLSFPPSLSLSFSSSETSEKERKRSDMEKRKP